MKNLSVDRKMIRFITIALVIGITVIMLASAITTAVSITNTSSQLAMQEVEVMAINTEENFDRYLGLYYAIALDSQIQDFLLETESPYLYVGNASNALGTLTQIWRNVNFLSVIRNDGVSLTRGTGVPYRLAEFEDRFVYDFKNESLSTGHELIRVLVCNRYSIRQDYTLTLFFPLFNTAIVGDFIGLLVVNLNDAIFDQLIAGNQNDRNMYMDTYFVHESGQIIAGPIDLVNTQLHQINPGHGRQVVITWGYMNIYRNLRRWNFFYVTRISWWELIRGSIWTVGVLFVFLSGMLLFIIKASKYFLEKVKEEQYQIDQIQMEALQSQIQPHFLYNTLECIHWQAVINGDQDTSKMIKSLASYYRIGLSKGKDIIHMEEELEHIRNYLYIQQMRYGDILEYEIKVDESVLMETIPKMTLQPLVENAIYHGIKCRDGKKGNIKIVVSDAGDKISIRIHDDGIGIDDEKIAEINRRISEYDSEFGYGVRNVNRRIQLYYGQEYGLHYEKNKGQGVTVMMYLPQKKMGFIKGQ
ncbi:MAG: sensor histidine kinase [Lachnospiraceae bacterium]|nr:sensor histidine kinase [Lachnospiraceae bacterium]